MNRLLQIPRLIVALLALIISQHALATPQELLSNLHKMRLLTAESLTNFYMYTGLDADSKYGQKITRSLSDFETLMASTQQMPAADGINDSIQNISMSWDKFSELMRINYKDMETQGFPNVRLVDEMGRVNTALLKQLGIAYEEAKQSSGISPTGVVERARGLAIIMEEITTQYAARGTSNLGQVFVGSYERSLEEMAEIFRQDFQALQTEATQESSKSLMRAINSKWNFMERSIKNYNENTVPFLVTSYSERIIINLEELVAMYD